MNLRKFGRTNIHVSEVGFGAWGIGGMMWQESDDNESIRALHKAIDLGINFIDTALAYGRGHSERLVSRLLKERKERIYVATKIPPKNGIWPPTKGIPLHKVFPKNYIIGCTEESLKNLDVETIDVQQFHVWDDDWTNEPEWFEGIQQLKREGKIRNFGISINDHQPDNALQLIRSGKVDTVQVIYNIFDQSPEDELFPLCQKESIGVIVRVPLDEGSLTGSITPETTFPEKDWRNSYFRGDRKKQIVERIEKLRKFLDGEIKSLAELALRFCLSHPAVSTVIPGMRTTQNVERNCVAAGKGKLPAPLVGELRLHKWLRNFYS
jgi:aryl-alcohol dehydrogenase-like predicted oxidoreductase